MPVQTLNSEGREFKIPARSLWRLTLGLAVLIAAAALAVFSLSGPVAADGHEVKFGACTPGSGGDPGGPCRTVKKVGTTTVRGLTAVQISAGSDHAYALKADGTLVSWGIAADGRRATPQLMVNRGNNVRIGRDDPADVRIGADDRPTINEAGQRSARGNRYLVDQEPVRWSQVAAGNLHTCAVTTEGEIYCWGDNSLKQTAIPLGLLGSSAFGEIPNPRFTKIVAGGYHTCVLEAETTIRVAPMRAGGASTMPAGSIVCWGDNSAGQTSVPGNPSAAYRGPLPNDWSAGLGGVAAETNGAIGDGEDGTTKTGARILYVDVTAGANHTCAVRTTGLVDCWGSNSHGQIRVPMQLRQSQSAVVSPSGGLVRSGEFHSIEAGENFTCAINREGGALCWGSNSWAQEYPPAGEYTQLSAGRWHACALSTFDDFPLREVNPEAPEPATRITSATGGTRVGETISLSPPGNMDCWGQDLGSGRTVPPTKVRRNRASNGRPITIPVKGWNQVSAGGTFTCGIFDMDGSADAPPPRSAGQATRFSATAAVSEGVVECWGMIERVPAPDVIKVVVKWKECVGGTDAVPATPAMGSIPAVGWGRIFGRVSEDGAIEFAFKVVREGPDIWINPQFRWVPRDGNLTVGRWYYSEVMTVSRYTDSAPGVEQAAAFGQAVPCGSRDMVVGRIAARLLPSGHMQLALMTLDGQVMANVPANHDRMPTPAETGKWWATDYVKWYDAR